MNGVIKNLILILSFLPVARMAIAADPVPTSVAPSLSPSVAVSTEFPPGDYALQKLRANGAGTEFIDLVLKKYHEHTEQRDRIVELNVLGFLGTADYSGHYSKLAIKKSIKYMRKYPSAFRLAEKYYGVPKEVVAALIWVESKMGNLLGTSPVASVYFSLLQADHPEVMKKTLEALRSKVPEPTEDQTNKVILRSRAKASWALTELKSLEVIFNRKAKDVKSLRGSYAGAFGLPQFIPSSYIQWARPYYKNKVPNLYDPRDSIMSIAFYLKANGWKNNLTEAQRESLFHYNRAKGYVDVILKLAQAIQQELKRPDWTGPKP